MSHARTFSRSPAVRSNVPLLIALIGPSGGGKTYSALRLASGIARVQPGPIDVIDTEADRALTYAGEFQFNHVPFAAPFGSLDYLAAFQQSAQAGARTIIVDSMSHEHEGPGGLLDQADEHIARALKRKGLDRDSDAGWAEEQKQKRSAWIEPKRGRTRLIQGMIQMHCNFILCFRSKEGTDQTKENGKTKIVKLGWVPIGGDAFWYEMTARALLLPGANGVPTWRTSLEGEKIAIRRPTPFEKILADGKQLSEDMGQAMAEWASGGADADLPAALAKVATAANGDALRAVAASLRARPWDASQRTQISSAIAARQKELAKPAQ